jgi:uncharacterized repeat protein (TIGR01451 family)
MNKKIFFILLAVVGVILIAFLFWRGNMFSKEILKLEILGQETAKVGDEIEYSIKYKNNGNFLLENPELIFVLPDNSLTEDGKTLIKQSLEDIYPGAEKIVKIKARLLGKEGELKTAKASLSYTPKNLTARYESDTTFTTKIDTVPITLDFDLPTKVEKGKGLQYSVNYFSNVDYSFDNLSLKIELTDGFKFLSSDQASLDNSEWKLKTLSKAQGGRITIKGEVNAETNKTLTFKAVLGMWKSGIFIVIKESTQDVEVIQPLLTITQEVNGSSSYVASPGETLNYQISFTNIGTSSFDKMYAIVTLDGSALDMSTVKVEDGKVQSNDNMIVFDSNSAPQLGSLKEQQTGQISFSVKVKSNWTPDNADEKTSIITDDVNISQIAQKFTIKVNSGLEISQSGFYQSYDIVNSGPIPPQVGKITTYVITWNIKNYSSDEKNVKVKAILGENVSLTGRIRPENEYANFSFDSASHEIVWSPGDILSGTGVNGDPVSLSFQVSFTPLESQKGLVAQLIGKAQVSGENQFTNITTTATDFAVTTALPNDLAHSGGGIVQ